MSLTPLEKAHEARRARKEAGETLVRLDPMEKARRKPTSLRLAVNAKCADCVGWHGDPGARGRIRDCNVVKCPLHNVRPYQRGADDDEDELPPQPILTKTAIRDGLSVLALLEDDRAFKSPDFASEELAESTLVQLLTNSVSEDTLLEYGWELVAE